LEITKKIGDVHPTRKMPGRTIWEGSWDKLLSISQEKLH
jgi:hypothetical protein